MMLSVPSVTMKGGIFSRVTSAPLRTAAGDAAEQAERKGDEDRHAVDDRQPPHHDRRDHHDHADRRSMPAVRITSVCAMPRMPMIVTWVSTVDRLLPVTKCEKLTVMPSSRPSTSTTKGTVVG